MIRFEAFARHGVTLAALSDKSDGDCAFHQGADLDAVRGARRRLCQHCDLDPAHLVAVQQVHGARVVRVKEKDRGRGAWDRSTAVGEADAIITDVPGLPITIQVADCVPVYLFDDRQKGIGLVHAGREGVSANITGRTVEAMISAWAAAPESLWALIGPSAGPCCYEVSTELANEFKTLGLPVSGRYLDLWEANVHQLVQAGVPPAQIIRTDLCTVCDGRFHSYRADTNAGRNLALFTL